MDTCGEAEWTRGDDMDTQHEDDGSDVDGHETHSSTLSSPDQCFHCPISSSQANNQQCKTNLTRVVNILSLPVPYIAINVSLSDYLLLRCSKGIFPLKYGHKTMHLCLDYGISIIFSPVRIE
jgi:hypothetical protein